jgi:hypothetical protein
MNRLALTLAVGALALCGVPSAHAGSAARQAPVAADTAATVQDTDMSSHRRHWRRHHHHHYGYYPRYHRSYAYYPRPYYYRPAPVVSFGFGFGGPRRHHWHHW